MGEEVEEKELPPIFQLPPHNWKGKEELALLQACEHYGFGNWEDISQKMGTRSPEECKEHYSSMYVFGNIGKATWEGKEPNPITDKTVEFEAPFIPPSTLTESTLQEYHQELGFMPYRNDFEFENDNDAESQICNLSWSDDDDDLDISIKLFQVDVYARKLQERNRRKNIVREHNLVSQFLNNKLKPPSSKKKASKEEKDFQSIKSFCQLTTCSEYTQFLENLKKEQDLKSRIKELFRYRRNGLSKLDEGTEFDSARIKREKKRDIKKKPGSSGPRRAGSSSKKHSEDKMSDSSQDEKGDDEGEEKNKSFDISTLPCFNLLSANEKKICTSARLKPSQYITFKTVLLRDYLDKQRGLNVKPKFPAGLDKLHRRRIINFLENSGWIASS